MKAEKNGKNMVCCILIFFSIKNDSYPLIECSIEIPKFIEVFVENFEIKKQDKPNLTKLRENRRKTLNFTKFYKKGE